MADKKISALTGATTPLAGTEVLPIVQSGATVKVAVSNLTAGRAISATQLTLTAGNVIPANGFGIDFSATSGTGTSELFADYEEGTWTPTLIGTTTNPTVTYSLQRGIYTKVGRVVTVSCYMGWSAFSGGSGNVGFSNLPFTIESSAGTFFAGSIALFDGFTLSALRTSVGLLGSAGTTYALPSCFGSAVSSQYIAVGSVAASGLVQYTLTYSV
jgi:hypothetical protein